MPLKGKTNQSKRDDSIAAVAKVMKDDEEVEDISDIEVEGSTVIE